LFERRHGAGSATDRDYVIPPMPATADDIIAALEAFVPGKVGGANVYELNQILEPYFGGLSNHYRVIPAMFELLERCWNADLGNPGPLVHCIEGQGIEEYEPLLLRSLQRRPVRSTIWMVNRILNTKLTQEHRERLLAALRSVADHALVSDSERDWAADFLEVQADPETG
jgi:hypothetical protein